MTAREQEQRAAVLRGQARKPAAPEDYAEALARYEQLCRLPEAKNWDFYHLAKCLYKTGRYQEALEACRQAWKRFVDPRPAALRNLSAWCLYQLELKRLPGGDDASEDVDGAGRRQRIVEPAVEAARRICNLTGQEPGSPYTRTILRLAQLLKKEQQWDEVERWTAKLDPARLSPVPAPWHGAGQGPGRTLASEQETWLALRARALLELGRHEDCIAICRQYEQSVAEPHYDWDVWVPYYEAQALAALGRRPEAEAVLERILPKKRAAWLLRLRAGLYRQAGDDGRAWQTALDAALELAGPEKDPRLLEMLAELAQARGQDEAARRHLELLLAARQEAGWGIPDRLRQLAAEMGVAAGNQGSRDNCRRLFAGLRRWWWQQLESVEPRSSGTVERVLGRGGFLRCDDGLSLYFLADELRQPEPGMRVSFWVRPNWDAKRQRVAPRAIRLRRLEPGRGGV